MANDSPSKGMLTRPPPKVNSLLSLFSEDYSAHAWHFGIYDFSA